MFTNSNHIVKPTIKALELASHELPILRDRLKSIKSDKERLDIEEKTTENEIAYYESVLNGATVAPGDNAAIHFGISSALKIKTKEEEEYLKLQTNIDKILFVTRHPELFQRKFFEGGKDVADLIVDLEKKWKDSEGLSDSLHATIQSTVSRLYIKGLLLKYRIKGTKGKLVAVHPDWLSGMDINEKKNILEQIELAPFEEEKLEFNITSLLSGILPKPGT